MRQPFYRSKQQPWTQWILTISAHCPVQGSKEKETGADVRVIHKMMQSVRALTWYLAPLRSRICFQTGITCARLRQQALDRGRDWTGTISPRKEGGKILFLLRKASISFTIEMMWRDIKENHIWTTCTWWIANVLKRSRTTHFHLVKCLYVKTWRDWCILTKHWTRKSVYIFYHIFFN